MLYLVFHLGEERYALAAKHVEEVLPLMDVRPIPGSALGVAGLFNYRGTLIPLLDLNQLVLGRPARPWLSSRVILVREENHLIGILVERATETVRREPASFSPPGIESAIAPYLGAVATDEQGVLQLIELDKLLTGSLRPQLIGQFGEVA